MNRTLSTLMPALLLAACTSAPGGTPAGDVSVADTAASSCPYLTKDNSGNIVMSWVRGTEGDSAVICFAVSADQGRSFGAPVEIAPSRGVYPHGENLPKLLFKPGGEVIAVWGGRSNDPRNKYAGVLRYARSRDGGRTWGAARPLVTDTASFDQRYFDLALLPNGEAGIIWLDNRKQDQREGQTMYFAETRPGEGFTDERPVQRGTCECCRTKLLVDAEGAIHVAYRAILGDTVRDMVHALSTDGGRTFSEPRRISADNWVLQGCPHSGPTMAEAGGMLHFAWYSAADDAPGVYASSSGDGGRSFAPRRLLSHHVQLPHAQMASLPGGAVATVWEETLRGDSSITAKIVLRTSAADGQPRMMDVSPGGALDGFPVLMPAGEGRVLVAWTRENALAIGASGMHHGRPPGGRVCWRLVRLDQAAPVPERAAALPAGADRGPQHGGMDCCAATSRLDGIALMPQGPYTAPGNNPNTP